MHIQASNYDKPSGAQILILQGEVPPRSELANLLGAAGYTVMLTALPRQALAWLTDDPYDVMILDLDTVGPDGVTYLNNASKLQPGLQIIVLTSKPTLRTAIASIRVSAADYLVKPIDISVIIESVMRSLETLAGLKNQLARFIREARFANNNGESDDAGHNPASNPQSVIIVPPVRLDFMRRRATLFEDPPRTIELTRGESAVLVGLMSYPDQPLTTEQLARHAWNYELDSFEAGDLVRPYIHRLRKKMEPNPQAPSLILTVRGRGYLFVSNRQSLSSEGG